MTGITCSRIASANPAISSAVSPFVRSATRKPAIWAGVSSPSMIEPISSRASARERWWPSSSSWIAGPTITPAPGSSSPSSGPSGVSTLSGWNWTPSIGNVVVPNTHHLAVCRVRGDRELGRDARVLPASGTDRPRPRPGGPRRRRGRRGESCWPCRAATAWHGRRCRRRPRRSAWWPRQTPSVGIVGPSALISSIETPAVSGRPGPGETTSRSNPAARAASTVIASFRTVTTSAPSSSNRCTRL